jgi:hypothetical protein
MDFNARPTALYVRIIALVSLLLGLNDAARLLGVQLGAQSPIEALGVTGFVYLAIFAGARLFAAVGLWIRASWGAVLLVGATGMELLLYLLGNADVRMSAPGFAVRLLLLAAIAVLFVLNWRHTRAQAAD